MIANQDFIQLLNTAIIKSKEREVDSSYEERLIRLCNSPAMKALEVATTYLSEKEKTSKDHAAIKLINTIRELDSVWNDYVLIEGINNLKEHLSTHLPQ